jgi:hypothetical protein
VIPPQAPSQCGGIHTIQGAAVTLARRGAIPHRLVGAARKWGEIERGRLGGQTDVAHDSAFLARPGRSGAAVNMNAFRARRPSPVHTVELRARMIRVSMLWSTHCLSEIGCGRHQIGAIISPGRGATAGFGTYCQASSRAAPGAPKIDAVKDLTDSRKGAILMR